MLLRAHGSELAHGFKLGLLGFVLGAEDALHPGRQLFTRIKLARGVHVRLQIGVHVHRLLVALCRAWRQRFHDDALKLLGDATVVGGGWQDLDVFDLFEDRQIVVHREQPLAGQQLIQHDAAGEDVRATVNRLAAHLLGRHIGELAFEDARLGLGLARGLHFGDAEVDELDLALVADHDVLRGYIAVDQLQVIAQRVLLAVRVVQRLAQLHHQHAGLRHRHRRGAVGKLLLTALCNAAQVAPGDVLHRNKVRVLDFAPVEHLADAGVI